MTRCSKCGRDANTFDSSWVCEDCMSEQLLDFIPTPYETEDETKQWLRSKGWHEFSYDGKMQWTSPHDLRVGLYSYERAILVQYIHETEGADMVNNPSHYNQGRFEVIDIIEAYYPDNYHMGNVIKYALRAQWKGDEITDLKKARWYLDRYINRLEERNDSGQ